MWRRIPAVQSVSAIVVVLLNIASWVPFIQDWFTKTNPSFDIRLIHLAFILLFVFIIYWIIHDLYKRIEELEDAKPTIVVTIPAEENHTNHLEVKNNGAVGKFSAQIEILEDNNNQFQGTSTLQGYWTLGADHGEAKIKQGHIDKLAIIDRVYDRNGNLVGAEPVYYYTGSDNTRGTLRSRSTATPLNPNYINIGGRINVIAWPRILKFKVTISSEPDLREGSFIQDYQWHSDFGLTEISQKESDAKT